MVISVKPASLRALTVRKTCSMQGLKQHMRVMRSLRKAFFAWGMASHGAGRSRKTESTAFWTVKPCLQTLR